MNHQSLYRKYRPQRFEDVLGQEHVTRTLQNALKTSPPSIVHAYLFCGPRGTGKTTTARILAKALNCAKGPTPIPCGECESCADITRGSSMDVLEIDAASHTGVDNVREVIISKVNFKPALGRYRMYIIDEAHQLSGHAFNALLKTIEEPPPHAVFVLATTEFQKVPATIQSRCQRFIFRYVSLQDITDRLQHVAKAECVKIKEGAVRALAKAAEGSLRDSLTLLEQVIAYSGEHVTEENVHAILGTISEDELDLVLKRVNAGDADDALKQTREILFRGISPASMAHALATHVRDRLVAAYGDISQQRSIELIELFAKAESDMRWHATHDLLLELALLKACSSANAQPSVQHRDAPVQGDSKEPPARIPVVRASAGTIPQSPAVQEAEEETDGGYEVEQTEETIVSGDQRLTVVWQRVLERVKAKSGSSLLALLLGSTPVALEGNRLVVSFQHEFHQNRVKDPARRQIIEEVLREFSDELPGDVILECCLGERKTATKESRESEEDLVDEAVSLFGATRVE